MAVEYGSYKIPYDVNKLSDIADPDMDICEFVKKWGTVGSSLTFSEAIKTSSMSDEAKGMAFELLGNLQSSLKKLRESGSCQCAFDKKG